MNILINEYVKLCIDIYFPVVEFDNPHLVVKSTQENILINGYYKYSPLKEIDGWIRLLRTEPEPDGFYAAYYVRANNKKVGVISFRGSDDFYDFAYHDLKLAVGEWPTVYEKALDFYKKVNEIHNPEHLSITGHSLGGGLAQLVGIEANKKRPENQKHPVICFNAPQMGCLIHDNPTRELRSDIDIKNNTFEERKKYFIQQKSLCTQEQKKLNLKSSARNFITSIHKNYICKNNHATFGGEIGNYLNFYHSSLNDLRSIYKNICSYKDIIKTPEIGQVAFNSIYDLLDIKDTQSIYPDDKSFSFTCNKYEKQYDFIFNFNSFFDIVHVAGKQLGNTVTVDIDKPEYVKYWQDTGEANKFYNYNEYKKSKAYQARLKGELRTCLTLHPEYFGNNNIWQGVKTSTFSMGDFLKLQVKQNCEVNLRSRGLGKTNLSIADAVDTFISEKLNAPSPNRDKLNEFIYMAKTQHVMANIGNVIMNEPLLKNISIGSDYKSAIDKIRAYKFKYRNQFDFNR